MWSAYDEREQDLLSLQEEEEGHSDKEKQVRNKFKKYVVKRSASGVGVVGGATAGVVIGSLILPGVGTFLGGVVGNMVGKYVGSHAGEAVGGALYDHDDKD